jgi:hypothetical protein
MLPVRTTVHIDDDLYRRVEARAPIEGRTVAAVLVDAVRIGPTTGQRAAPERFEVPAHGSGGVVPGLDLASNAAVREVLDQGVGLEQMR